MHGQTDSLLNMEKEPSSSMPWILTCYKEQLAEALAIAPLRLCQEQGVWLSARPLVSYQLTGPRSCDARAERTARTVFCVASLSQHRTLIGTPHIFGVEPQKAMQLPLGRTPCAQPLGDLLLGHQ